MARARVHAQAEIREMAAVHPRGRDRAALWLWEKHNLVNERLAAEQLSDSPATQFVEFAKVQWPSRSGCQECRQMTRPQPGVKVQVHWRHEGVLRLLFEQVTRPRAPTTHEPRRLSLLPGLLRPSPRPLSPSLAFSHLLPPSRALSRLFAPSPTFPRPLPPSLTFPRLLAPSLAVLPRATLRVLGRAHAHAGRARGQPRGHGRRARRDQPTSHATPRASPHPPCSHVTRATSRLPTPSSAHPRALPAPPGRRGADVSALRHAGTHTTVGLLGLAVLLLGCCCLYGGGGGAGGAPCPTVVGGGGKPGRKKADHVI